MWRIAVIAVASLIGAASLSMAADQTAQDDASGAHKKPVLTAASEEVEKRTQMRLCLGPARVTLGGRPRARLAFGGEGCDRRSVKLLGVRLLRSRSEMGSARGMTSL